MYWVVGFKVGAESGQLTVHPHTLESGDWKNAIEYALEFAQVLHPSKRIEFEWIKEYE